MKISKVKNIIKESIKQLMNEQERGTCFDVTKTDKSDIQIKEQTNDKHKWEVCSMKLSNGVSVSASWTGAFSFAALGPTSGAGVMATFDAFYNWVVGQVGPINVGDTIEFDMVGSGMCGWLGHNNINVICFKYLGELPFSNGTCWNGTTATSISSDCCSGFSGGTEDKGCMDPNALNNGECCSGDPNCTVIGSNQECCRYDGDDDGDDDGDMEQCQCCNKNGGAQSMAQQVAFGECASLNDAAAGLYNCQPSSGGTLQCKKPLPTDPTAVDESIIRMQKLANIKK